MAAPGEVFAAIWADWRFRVPSIRVAEARAGGDGATWMYRFDGVPRSVNGGLGSCHTTEIPFVFDTIEVPATHPRIGDAPSLTTAGSCHGSWVRFISAGDPGWPRYDLSTRATAVLTDRIDVIDDPGSAERTAW